MTKNINDSLDLCMSIIVRVKSIFVLLLLLLLIIQCCNGTQSLNNHNDCPVYCSCYIWYQLTWASCAGKRLVNVHTGVSEMVQALDLSNNSISKLEDYEFATMGMLKLEYLNLSLNAISEISLFAFAQLHKLKILDLSTNHLDYLIPDTFISNNKLQIVKLTANNFHYNAPRLKSSTITELSLSGCQISYLPSGIFDGLKRLTNLDISNNVMIELDLGIIKSLQYLRTLKINGNPWSCNNAMKSLKIILNSKSISYNSSICEDKKWNSNNLLVKFERIVFQNFKSQKTNNPNSELISLPANIKGGNKSWKNSTLKSTNSSNNNNNNCKIVNTSTLTMNLPPLWLFIAGFTVGCAVGMISIYIWLSRQHLNELSQFTLLDNTSTPSDSTLPTYCEVMLHSNRYPHI